MESGVAALSSYNGLGWFYDRYWRKLSAKFLPALDRLVLSALPRGSRVLDLCCGTGHLAAALCRRGLTVVGVDASQDMLRFARQNAPQAGFIAADARQCRFQSWFDAVISTGDSLNHFLTLAEVEAVFGNVFRALVPGGVFVFDMNLAEAFETQWHKSSTVVAADHLIYVRGRYDRLKRLGATEITTFQRDRGWNRRDLSLSQRCYRQGEIRACLERAGFTRTAAHPAAKLGLRGRLAVGRAFFAAAKAHDTRRMLAK